MNDLTHGFAAAQRAYDRMEPEDTSECFDDGDRIGDFIRDFAQCDDPAKWLFNEGVKGEWDTNNDDVAQLLQSLCITNVAGHQLQQGGDKFWQVMKRMAIDRFEEQQDNL